jgi:hypothetical protein
LLAHVWWFAPGTPASFTTKTDRHDIAEILLKVALSTTNQSTYVLSGRAWSYINEFYSKTQSAVIVIMRSTRSEPPIMGMQLVSFITYGCK